jgi:hypothetical protein
MAFQDFFDDVQKLYIAYYQRPADPGGLRFWAQRLEAAGGSLAGIIDAFATSAEATALYGTIDASTIGNVIDSIYQALFGRAPDAAGKQFYIDGFTSGRFTAGSIALDILNGARNEDAVAIQNKLIVADRFTSAVDGRPLSDPDFGTGTSFAATYAGNADAQAARAFLATVTSNPATVPSQAQVIQEIQTHIADPGDSILNVPSGQTFTLTTGVDNITGTSGNDTIIADNTGTTAQLSAADQINGGGGTDTLKIYAASSDALESTVFGQLTSVENIYINNGTLTNNKTLDVSGLTGVTSIALDSPKAMGDGKAFTLKTAAGQAVSLTKVVGTAGGATSTFKLDGASDVTLNGVGTDLTLDLTSTGTALKLTTTGAASTITLANTGAALATLTVAGDKALNVTTSAGALKTVTSTATGDVTFNNAGGVVENYTGGAGKDILTLVGANVKNVSTGAGNDQVTILTSALAAASTIDLGDGDDILIVPAGGLANLTSGAQLKGGDGTDRLVTKETAVLTAAQIAKINASSGFEVLGFAANGSGVDVANLTSINKFYVEGNTGVTISNANSNTQTTINLDSNNGNTITIGNAVGENSTTVAIDNQSGAPKTLSGLTVTGITNVALSSTGSSGSENTITTLTNSDNTNLTITGNTDLTITNALSATAVGSKVDAGTFTGKLTVTGSSKADVIIGGSGNDTITGGGGNDTIDLTKGGNDKVIFSAAASNGVDTIKGFTVGANNDTIQLDKNDTTAPTTGVQAAWATHGVATVNNGAAYILSGGDIGTESGAQTFADSDVIELIGGNDASADLDAATDGTELLKYLATSGAASGITVAGAGHKAYLIAYDNGKAYLYHAADSGGDSTISAGEITLVGVFEGVAPGGFVPANVFMS